MWYFLQIRTVLWPTLYPDHSTDNQSEQAMYSVHSPTTITPHSVQYMWNIYFSETQPSWKFLIALNLWHTFGMKLWQCKCLIDYLWYISCYRPVLCVAMTNLPYSGWRNNCTLPDTVQTTDQWEGWPQWGEELTDKSVMMAGAWK